MVKTTIAVATVAAFIAAGQFDVITTPSRDYEIAMERERDIKAEQIVEYEIEYPRREKISVDHIGVVHGTQSIMTPYGYIERDHKMSD